MKRLLVYSILLLASIFVSFSSHSFMQEIDEDHPFGLIFDDGEALEVENAVTSSNFIFTLPKKYYLYKDKFRVVVDQKNVQVTLKLPKSMSKFDEFQEEELDVYYDQVEVGVDFKFLKEFPGSLTGMIIYQGCSTKLCYRPMKQKFEFELIDKAGGQKLDKKSEQVISQASTTKSYVDYLDANSLTEVLHELGLALTLLLIFIAGVLTGFTPCVLPVIPLTLAFIGVAPNKKKSERIIPLLIFVLGLVATYSILGVLSAYLGKSLGFWFQSVYFEAFLVLFFLAMGLWMLGVLNLNLPSSLQNKIVSVQPKGLKRYFYSGLTIGFLAAPCVGPIVGLILVYISATQNIFLGFIFMAFYSLGLSVLFVLLGFFSREWVGRFGNKSNWMKKVLGTSLILAGVFYLFVIVKPYLPKDDSFFRHDFEKAKIEAENSSKGLVLDFYADWCIPCKKWDRNIWSQKDVQNQVLEKYIPVKLDCTHDCSEMEKKFQVKGYPTIIFLDKNQKENKNERIIGGPYEKKLFLDLLKEKEVK